MSDDNTTVKLYVDKELTAGTLYKINFKVDGVSNNEDVKNVAGIAMSGDKKEVTFAGPSVKHAKPQIESAYALSEKVLRVKFNQKLDVNVKALNNTSNSDALFTIDGVSTYSVADADASTPDDMTYDITVNDSGVKFVKGEIYKVSVASSVVDLTGTAVDYSVETQFVGIAPALVSVKYISKAGNNNDTLTLTFNSELGTATSLTKDDYTVTLDGVSGVGSVKVEGSTVVLTLTESDNVTGTNGTISIGTGKIADKASTPNTNAEITSYSFTK